MCILFADNAYFIYGSFKKNVHIFCFKLVFAFHRKCIYDLRNSHMQA